MKRFIGVFTLFFLCLNIQSFGQSAGVQAILKSLIPGIEVNKIMVSDHFLEEYEILIPQMIDHKDPKAGFFKQRIFLSHFDINAPIVFVTEGYAARDKTYELSSELRTNQIIVEYRFFGKSVPEELDWKYLSNRQAMKDLHQIHQLFSKIYPTKNWITTGISKGGTTCLFYKAYYPKDSRIAVPYVGPMPNAPEDTRCDEHLETIGSEECRTTLKNFQKKALSQKADIIPFIDSMALADNLSFSMGARKALEYSVLELSFSFWQFAHDCDKIPENASPLESFRYLSNISGFNLYEDKTMEYYEPAFYQFITENGYYGFVYEHLKDEIQELKVYNNRFFAPQEADLSYRPELMNKAKRKLKRKKRILQIQGEYDPWGACGLVLQGKDQYYYEKKGGGHSTRINSFNEETRDQIYEIIGSWMK